MTPQEERILNALIDHIRQAPPSAYSSDLQQRIDQAFGRNPDALLPLAQAAIAAQSQFEYSQIQLQQAQAELAQLRSQPGAPPQQASGGSVSSFFSNLFGGGSPTPQGPPTYSGQPQPGYPGSTSASPTQPRQGYQPVNAGPQQTPPPAYQPVNAPNPYGQTYPQQPGWNQPQTYAQPYAQPYPQQAPPYGQPSPYAQPGYAPSYGWAAPSTGGGMMTRIAETAAGVAAGAVVAEGVESMLHGFGHEHESDRDYSSPPPEERPRNESANSSFYNPQHDVSRDLSPSDDSRSSFGDVGASEGSWQDEPAASADDSADDNTDDSSGFDDSGSDFGGDDNS